MKTEFTLNKNLPGKGNFPLPPKTKINLTMLKNKLQGTPFLNGDTNHKAYIQLHFYIQSEKNSFKVFKEGGINCNITISPIAWNKFLDFFYYTFVINCLEEIK